MPAESTLAVLFPDIQLMRCSNHCVGAPRLKQVAVEVSNRSSKYDVAISLQLTSHDVVHTNAGREHIDGALSVYSTDQVLQP
jgi:hypothetical protein